MKTETTVSDLKAVYQKDGNFVTRKVAGELILVPIRQDAGQLAGFYAMNPVGGRIWELLDGKRPIADIARIVFDEYDVDVQRAEKETMGFIGHLAEMGIVTLDAAGR